MVTNARVSEITIVKVSSWTAAVRKALCETYLHDNFAVFLRFPDILYLGL